MARSRIPALLWPCLILMVAMIAENAHAQSGASRQEQLNSLADAEREFAATTVKEGFRDGFIKFFADDGIGFGPHPQRTKSELAKSPPATGPRKVIFNWAPMFGDISFAGDLGYTTGPVIYTDVTANPKPPRQGMYFSVWQKQPDGTWKVAIDMGIDTPEAVAPIETSFTAASPVRHSEPSAKGTLGEEYRRLDQEFFESIGKTGTEKAYTARLDKQFRIHRKGMMPVTELGQLGKVTNSSPRFEFIDGKIASSNDLAFTYGKYTSGNGEKDAETGYYVHVWRRDNAGSWKLVADIQNPLPKTEK